MQFFQHYGEPSLKISIPLQLIMGLGSVEFLMEFDPKTVKWTNVSITEQGEILGSADFSRSTVV